MISMIHPKGRGVASASELASLSSLGEDFGSETPRDTQSSFASDATNPDNATPLRVLLTEDHVLVRAGIRALLESVDGVEVVGEASNGAAALALIESGIAPDVAILDVSMQGMSGLELASRIAISHPKTRIVMLSMHASGEYVRQAMQNGAVGYLLKDSGTDELETALRTVMRGETYLSPSIQLDAEAQTNLPKRAGNDVSAALLTPRQREILILLAQGFPNGQIAQRLSISVKTVETHRAQLMERLSIYDIAGLVRYAIRNGLIAAD